MIELRNVQKRFGTRLAVDELTLTVPRGEFLGCSVTTVRARALPSG